MNILLLILAMIFYGYEFALRLLPASLASDWILDFSLTPLSLSVVASVYYGVYAFSQWGVGWALGRYRVSAILAWGAVLVSVGLALMASAGGLSMLLLGRLALGMGSATAFIACIELAHQDWPERTSYFVGLTNSAGIVGALLGGAPLWSVLNTWSWRWGLSCLSTVSVVFACCFLLLSPRSRLPSPKPSAKLLPLSAKQWGVAIYAGVMVLPVVVLGELWGAMELSERLALSGMYANLFNSLIFLGIGLGGPLWGSWVKYYPRKRLLRYGHALVLLSLCGLLAAPLPYLMLFLGLLECLLGFGASSMLLCFAWQGELTASSESTGSVFAQTNLVIMLTGALGQLLVGWLFNQEMRTALWAIVMAVSVAGVWLWRQEESPLLQRSE